jgi:hypothetical protein
MDTNNVTGATKVLDVTDITTGTNISDGSYDLSSTSDIPQVTFEGEVVKVYHYVDMEYDRNGPPVPSSDPTPCPSRTPRKPPYSKQCGNTTPMTCLLMSFNRPMSMNLKQW